MRKFLAGFVLVLMLTSLVAGQRGQRASAPAGQQVASTAKPSDDQTLSVNVDLVNILFTVADRKGKFVTNLKKEDFKVFEDEKGQTISNFSSESDLPLTIALLVDTSGSIRDK